MVAMAVIIGVGVAAIFMVALGYVTSYASAEARVMAEHRTLMRSHERIIQQFDPRRLPLRYQGDRRFGDLDGTPNVDPRTPIIIFMSGSRPVRDPISGQILWTWADSESADVLRTPREYRECLPEDVYPRWSTPREVCQNIIVQPDRWSARKPYRVRRIY